jgi:hypothetical protein
LSKVVTENLGVLVQRLLSQVLGHEIGRIARPKHFGELDNAAELLFLQPQDADVKVPNSSNSLSLEYAERRSGVDM